jgi:hypothetical protein
MEYRVLYLRKTIPSKQHSLETGFFKAQLSQSRKSCDFDWLALEVGNITFSTAVFGYMFGRVVSLF